MMAWRYANATSAGARSMVAHAAACRAANASRVGVDRDEQKRHPYRQSQDSNHVSSFCRPKREGGTAIF